MTSIYDIPYEDIVKFLLANNKNIEDENEAYNEALFLLKNRKTIGHTKSIIEWMMAHNLLIRNINIPNYNIYDIDKMSQNEINQLAKLLKMKGNNVENIKNILRYLNKLDHKNIILLPEINDTILKNLNDLEISTVDFEILEPNTIINLLKTHRNKSLIRKKIYNNLEKILFYNFVDIDIRRLKDLLYIEDLTYQLPKYYILDLLKTYEKRLDYDVEEINNLFDYLEESRLGIMNTHVYQGNMRNLIRFLVDLINIDEIGLAKKVFDIAYKYKFVTTFGDGQHSLINYLLQNSLYYFDNNFVVKILLDFIGEDNFMGHLETIISNLSDTRDIKSFNNRLISLGKYDLLVKVFETLAFKNYKGSGEVINIILPKLKKVIKLKNHDLIIKYINIIDLAIDDKLTLSIDDLIKDIEQD